MIFANTRVVGGFCSSYMCLHVSTSPDVYQKVESRQSVCKLPLYLLNGSHQKKIRFSHKSSPVATHKLVIQWLNTLNRANRHSVESEPFAALRLILG